MIRFGVASAKPVSHLVHRSCGGTKSSPLLQSRSPGHHAGDQSRVTTHRDRGSDGNQDLGNLDDGKLLLNPLRVIPESRFEKSGRFDIDVREEESWCKTLEKQSEVLKKSLETADAGVVKGTKHAKRHYIRLCREERNNATKRPAKSAATENQNWPQRITAR